MADGMDLGSLSLEQLSQFKQQEETKLNTITSWVPEGWGREGTALSITCLLTVSLVVNPLKNPVALPQ